MSILKNYNLLSEKKFNTILKYTIMRNILSLSCILLLSSLYSCKEKTEIAELKKEKFCLTVPLKNKITIDTIRTRPVAEELTLTGNVSYNPDKVVQFVSLVDGVITSTNFSLGDYVKKGQVLAEIKSTELNELQSERKSLESQLLVANRELASVKSMFQDGIASQKDLISAESEVNVLKASLQNKIDNLNLFSASSERGVFQIKAPTNGYVVAKNMSSGTQIASGGDPLFTISELDEVWVIVNIYATNMQNVKENMEVEIKTLAYPDEIFKGKIAALSQVFDAEEHVLKARVVMKNKDLKLKPGMSADIIIKKESKQNAIAIPAKAILFDNNQNYILVYQSDCKIEARKVEPIAKNNNWVFVNENFTENEKVITKNHLLIYEQIKM